MKCRRLLLVALVILVVTALSTAVATAQDNAQQAQSGEVAMPADVTGSSPLNINSNFDTGNEQISTSQKVGPQPKQPREERTRGSKDPAAPTTAVPTGGTYTKPGASDGNSGARAPGPSPQTKAELPKTGGASTGSLFCLGAGTLLVAAGLLGRKMIK
jgi:LPXTG-motif cell wall-anchored protein